MWKRTLIFAILHAIAGAAFYLVFVSDEGGWSGGHRHPLWLALPLLAGFLLNLIYAARQRPERPGHLLAVVLAAPLAGVLLAGIHAFSSVRTWSDLWSFSVSMTFESIFAYVAFVPSWIGLMIGMGFARRFAGPAPAPVAAGGTGGSIEGEKSKAGGDLP
ncbi:MAG TPA: hypothetical protein VKA53_10850 [Thermoanaerobaculia bacterium]|nr:hypothetical protein [Thermoanaerobaculia bacterium]